MIISLSFHAAFTLVVTLALTISIPSTAMEDAAAEMTALLTSADNILVQATSASGWAESSF